jgi:hypothetical protein
MLKPPDVDPGMRMAILLLLACVVIIAPVIGVYALSPIVFSWGLLPYPLAVVLSVMAAEAGLICAVVFLVFPRR